MRFIPAFILVLAAALALSGFGAGTAEAGVSRDCGTVRGEVPLYDLTALGTGCRAARHTAKDWLAAVFAGECTRFDCRVRGYRCRARPPAEVEYVVRCRNDLRRIRWTVFAD